MQQSFSAKSASKKGIKENENYFRKNTRASRAYQSYGFQES
jgi:hypothetical protein